MKLETRRKRTTPVAQQRFRTLKNLMFCPQCGQERTSQETSFCSRCGFLLTGTTELLLTGGAPLVPAVGPDSPRSRGIKRGLFMFLLTFLIAPLVGILSVFALGIRPWPVGIVVILLGLGGLLRMVYALLFESKYSPGAPEGGRDLNLASTVFTPAGLPPPAANEYTSPRSGRWLDTNDLEPASVTDSTTKLLEKELGPPA